MPVQRVRFSHSVLVHLQQMLKRSQLRRFSRCNELRPTRFWCMAMRHAFPTWTSVPAGSIKRLLPERFQYDRR